MTYMKVFPALCAVLVLLLAAAVFIGTNQPPVVNSPPEYQAPPVAPDDLPQHYVHTSNQTFTILIVGVAAILFVVLRNLKGDKTSASIYVNTKPEEKFTQSFMQNQHMSKWHHPGR